MASWKSQNSEPQRLPEEAEAEHEMFLFPAVAEGAVGRATDNSSRFLNGNSFLKIQARKIFKAKSNLQAK